LGYLGYLEIAGGWVDPKQGRWVVNEDCS